jgi:hypothetical protein
MALLPLESDIIQLEIQVKFRIRIQINKPKQSKSLTYVMHKRADRAIVFLKPLLTIYLLYRGDQFLCGGNRDTMRKQPTCRKSLTKLSHNLVSSTPSHERDSNFSDDRH